MKWGTQAAVKGRAPFMHSFLWSVVKKTALLLLALLLTAPFAAAGSATDPEITDATGDKVSSIPGLGASGVDISAAWVGEETPDNFTIYLKVDAQPVPDATETISYELSLGGVDFGGEVFTGGASQTYTATGETTAFDATSSTISFVIPRSSFGELIPGQDLSGFTATATAYVGDPAIWNDSDNAPDSGSGSPYIIGSNAAPGMDYDEDGLDDADEIRLGSDPTLADSDGDGLSDGDEVNTYGTDPADADSDDDNLNDGDEIAAGTDPLNPDTDGDGIGDGNETGSPLLVDTDGDGLDDWEEAQAGTNPNLADSDGDGIDDKTELDNGMDPMDAADGAADPDGDGVSTSDEFAMGSNPFVADQEEQDDVILGTDIPFELPGDLADYVWIIVLVLLLALIIFLIVLIVRKIRGGSGEEPEEEEPEDDDAADVSSLESDLTLEQIANARRLFEERERRRLDYISPDRDRSLDTPMFDEPEAIEEAEFELSKEAKKQAKLEEKEEKKREKALAKLAKKEAKIRD